MLEYLTNKMTHESIIERINKKQENKNTVVNETANDYYLLFQQQIQDMQNALVGTQGIKERLNKLKLGESK